MLYQPPEEEHSFSQPVLPRSSSRISFHDSTAPVGRKGREKRRENSGKGEGEKNRNRGKDLLSRYLLSTYHVIGWLNLIVMWSLSLRNFRSVLGSEYKITTHFNTKVVEKGMTYQAELGSIPPKKHLLYWIMKNYTCPGRGKGHVQE